MALPTNWVRAAAVCFLLWSGIAAGQDIDEGCLECLCVALSRERNCNDGLGCRTVGSVEHCGRYQFSHEAWHTGGQHIIRGDDHNEPEAWKRCLNNFRCATKTLNTLIKDNHKDCDDDGKIDCLDYGLAAMLGGDCRNREQQGILIRENYYSTFKRCALKSIRRKKRRNRRTSTTSTTVASTPHTAATSPAIDVTTTAAPLFPPPLAHQVDILTKFSEAANTSLERDRYFENQNSKLEGRVVAVGSAAQRYRELHAVLPAFLPLLRAGQRLTRLLRLAVEDSVLGKTPPEELLIKLVDPNIYLGYNADPQMCPKTVCNQASPYRSIDGSCNAVENDFRKGSAGNAYTRTLHPAYGDGYNSLRAAKSGEQLPSARALSRALSRRAALGDSGGASAFLPVWGRFIHRDMFHTPISRGLTNHSWTCCVDGHIQTDLINNDCAPIPLDADDPTFARGAGGRKNFCMHFVRSAATPSRDCRFSGRNQLSQTSAFIDASHIYGMTEETARSLRDTTGPKLKTRRGIYLPHGSTGQLLDAGDLRVNEDLLLALLHTIWVSRHNFFVEELERINREWDDEKIFQEARKIVGAEIQHITYNEYLPLVLGKNDNSLLPQDNGYFGGYDKNADPSITDYFAAAVAYFVDSMSSNEIKEVSKIGQAKSTKLRDASASKLEQHLSSGTAADLIRALFSFKPEPLDVAFAEELTEGYLASDADPGFDLLAMHIQRGRDHGIAPYVKWREYCDPTRAAGLFSDLADLTISTRTLQELYEHVEDIDLLVGALAEPPVGDALVGPTLHCLLTRQFSALKTGDRFFYENGGGNVQFTSRQLQQIRKTSLARVLCDISARTGIFLRNHIDEIPAEVLRAPSFAIPSHPCNNHQAIPTIDLLNWRQ